MKTYDSIVISDIHLGAENCEAKELSSFLESILNGEVKTQSLIINGDLFDSFDFRRLKKTHWKVMSLLRKLSDKIQIFHIQGNHDAPAEFLSHILGTQVEKEHHIYSGNKKILVLHGDIFDDFLNDHVIATWFADVIYNLLQKIDKNHNMARWAKSNSKTFLRCADKIKKHSKEYAKKMNFNTVICGHVHFAEIDSSDIIEYGNSGCWTEKPSSYIAIKDGILELKYFN